MLREMMVAKLHRATITACELGYMGSLTVDEDLLDGCGMLVNQRIQVVNLNNGERFETYVIPGPRGSGAIVVNGAAARLAMPGDPVIIIAYALLDDAEARSVQPVVLVLDAANGVAERRLGR
jgi:aspartate 1-decarboxylase